jgi:hypothetical protein
MNIETVTRSARALEQACEVGIVNNSDWAYGCFRFGETGVLFLTYYAHEAVDVNTYGGKCDILSSHQTYYSDTLRILNIIVQTVLAGFAFSASFRLWAFWQNSGANEERMCDETRGQGCTVFYQWLHRFDGF